MATGKATSKDRKDFWAQQTKLWQQPTHAWETFLKQPGIGADEVVVAGTRIKLCCPFHPDTNPSGHINTTKGYYKCFSESCRKGVKDPIKLVQRLMNVSYTEAFDAFRRHFKLSRTIRSDVVKAFDEETTLRARMNLVSDVCWQYLCNVWTATTAPESAQATCHWLRQSRGLKDIIPMTALGMLPRKPDLVRLCQEAKASEADVKWIMRFLNDYLGTGYMDCVVYTYAIAPDHVTAFKLRKPEPDKDSVRVVRLSDEDPMGCFGLTHSAYSPLIWSDKVDNVILVEGEHDQLAAYQGQCDKVIYDEIFVALGGGGHQGVDFLSRIGLTKASIVGDHDAAGEEYPVNILKKTNKVSIKVFDWPLELQNPTGGKYDPDEAIKFHGFDSFYKATVAEKNYSYASRWCHQRAVNALTDVDPDDVMEQETVVSEIASLLRNDTELRSFATMVANDFPLLTPARIRLASAKYDENPVGFVQSIADWITQQFHIISVDNDTNILKLWHKEKRKEVDILVGLKRGIITFKAYTPTGVLYEWVRDEIGLPGYLPDPQAPEATHAALARCESDISDSLEMAFSALSSQAKESPWLLKGQGVHLVNVDAGDPGYIVNGNRIYKLEWTGDGRNFKEVSELDGPSDGTSVFNIRRNDLICPAGMAAGWLPFLSEAKNLLRPAKYSLRQAFDIVEEIFNLSCEFEFQSVDVRYSALLVFYGYVFDTMQKRVMTHILGPFESGKSAYLSLACGLGQLQGCALTYNAATSDSCTSASIFQHFNSTRCMLGLDEANDPGDGSHESQKIQQLYRRLRGLATKGMADYIVGTTDGRGTSYFIHNPVVTASATVIDDSMDDSRFNTLRLRKNPNKANTYTMLREKYGLKVFRDLRESICLEILRVAPQIANTYQNAYVNYGKSTTRTLKRRHENILPLVAVAKVIGLDGDKFFDDYSASRQGVVEERRASSPGNALIDAIINSPHVQIGSDDVPLKKSLRSVLQRTEWREMINSSDTGIYFDEVSGCLGIIWPQVRQTLLVGSLSKYGRMSITSLRSKAAESQYFIRPDEARRTGISMRLRASGMVGSAATSIFDVKHILQAAAAARKDFLAVQKAAKAAEADDPPDEDDPLSGVNL
jgi:hypothetical protein